MSASAQTTAPQPAAGKSSADVAWRKVDDAINTLERGPVTRPKTPQESRDAAKKLLQSYDDAVGAFLDKFPNDPRRWKIKLIEAKTAAARGSVGLPVKSDRYTLLREIANAPDADKETKGEASGILVWQAAASLQSGAGREDQWLKQAEAHLKAYPTGEYSERIQAEVESLKVLAELKTKPLDLKFTAVDGRKVDLAQMRGKVVLIDFWAVWCGPCVTEMPNVIAAYEKLHPKGFEIVGISLDEDKSKLLGFLKQRNMTWPQYFDGKGWENEISSRYGIHSIPAMWLVNKKGMVVDTNARGKLEAEVERLLAE